MKQSMTIFLSLLFILPVSAYEKNQISKVDFFKRHNSLIKILVEHDKKQTYPSQLIKEGELYSSFNIYQLIFSDAYADAPSMCFFGGWATFKSGSRCQTPWSHKESPALEEYGARYDRAHNCSGRPDTFRCNPTLFGGDLDGKGKCIEIENYNDVTKICYEETRGDLDSLYERYISDENFKQNYLNTVSKVSSFCQNNDAYTACTYLLQSINDFQEKVCAETIEPTLGENVMSFLRGVVESISPTSSLPEDAGPSSAPESSLRPQLRPERTTSSDICNDFYNGYIDKGVPEKALKQALMYYEDNKDQFTNQKWISIADYSQGSSNERFFMINLENGDVETHKVSHGSGNNGTTAGTGGSKETLQSCSHVSGSNKTRAGFFNVAGTAVSGQTGWTSIEGRDGNSYNKLIMQGLSGDSINGQAEGDYVVMHGADYNHSGNRSMGRSYGCPAFVPADAPGIMNEIQGGSLFYSYVGNNCAGYQGQVDDSVAGWQNMCTTSSPNSANNADASEADTTALTLTAGSSAPASSLRLRPRPANPVRVPAEDSPHVTTTSTTYSSSITIQPRSAWGARPFDDEDRSFKCMDYNQLMSFASSLSLEDKLKRIYQNGRIVVHHAASAQSLSGIQSSHMNDRGLLDVSYHYLIGFDGQIYEGRSLETMGAHAGALPRSRYTCSDGQKNQDVSEDFDYKSIGIMLKGNLQVNAPRDAQYEALKSLIEDLKSRFEINHISPHQHVRAGGTDCPGAVLLQRLSNDSSSFTFSPRPAGNYNTMYEENSCSAPSTSCN
jgi:hypothetical protein